MHIKSNYINIHPVRVNIASYIHVKLDNLSIGTYVIKLIDKSDIVNYPHDIDGTLGLEYVQVQADATGIAEYNVCIGYLSDVNASDGKFNCFKRWSEQKAVGASMVESVVFGHPGILVSPENILTRDTYTAQTLSSTATPISTLFPTGDTVGFEDGDIGAVVNVLAGSVNVTFELMYYAE